MRGCIFRASCNGYFVCNKHSILYSRWKCTDIYSNDSGGCQPFAYEPPLHDNNYTDKAVFGTRAIGTKAIY